jgi:hypothetical protein
MLPHIAINGSDGTFVRLSQMWDGCFATHNPLFRLSNTTTSMF